MKIAIPLLVLLAPACTPEVHAPSPSLPELPPALARHREWSGGAEAWNRLRTLRFEGTLATSGLSGTVTWSLGREGTLRQDYVLGTLRGSEGIDAAGAWKLNQSGQVEALTSAAARRHRSALQLAFGGHFTGALRAEAGPSVERGGTRYDVVEVTLEPDRTLELLIASDGELRFRHERGPNGESWTELGDSTVVAGVRIPRREVVTGEGAQTLTWSRITANDEVPAASFARPAAEAKAGSLPGGVATVRVGIELHQERYVYTQGKLSDFATDIVVDSGAGITVVDAAVAAKAGLRGGTAIAAKGVGGESRSVQLATGVRLELGGVILDGLTVAILDLTEVHEKVGRPMPVILGKELFHAFTVDLDYDRRELRIHDPARHVAPDGVVILPTRPLEDGHVMVELGFEDLPPAWFMVDTGSGDTLALHQPYVAAHSLLTRYPRLAERRIGGVGGTLPAKAATAGVVHFAGRTFTKVPVVLATEAKGAFADPSSAGTLGAGLLGRFCVTFDYPRQRLLLTAGQRVGAPFTKDRLGMSLRVEAGKLLVDWVAPNGSAERAGVRVGEVVVGVDGVRGDAQVLRGALWGHAAERNRTELVLDLADRRLTVTLTEYY